MATSLINKEQITRIFGNTAISMSAGTVGTYVGQSDVDIAVSGYVPVSCTLRGMGHQSSYHPVIKLRPDQNLVNIVFYRVTASAYDIPANDVNVIVVYEKA